VILKFICDINYIIDIGKPSASPSINFIKKILFPFLILNFCPLLVFFLIDCLPPRTQEASLTRMRVRVPNFILKSYIRVSSNSSPKYLEL
jgi:hypothetical protein